MSAIYKPHNTDIIHYTDDILQYFNNLTTNNDLFNKNVFKYFKL